MKTQDIIERPLFANADDNGVINIVNLIPWSLPCTNLCCEGWV